MSNARNLGELLEADGEVPSGKIDSVAASKLSGTIAAASFATGSIDSAHVAAGAVDDAHISGLAATKLTGTIAAARLDTATTQAESDDSTKIATTAYVVDKITTLIGGAPSTLNDLNELAAAINDDNDYNSTLTTALATKLPLAGGTMTGVLNVSAAKDNGWLVQLNNTGTGSDANGLLVHAGVDTADYIFKCEEGDGTSVLAVKYGGKVGIGTTTPTSGLEIFEQGLAVGSGSTASGTVGSVAIGHAVTASGNRSFVFGREMTVSGDYSFGIALNDQNGTNLSATNTMAIVGGNVGIGTTTPTHPLSVTGDTIQNGVRTFTARFNVANNASIGFDVNVPNEGGGGNSFMIHCGHNHYYVTSYGTHRIAMISARGTSISDVINVGHQTSGNGGSWTFSKPSSTLLRITKNAGTYAGGGAGFIHVTFSSFM